MKKPSWSARLPAWLDRYFNIPFWPDIAFWAGFLLLNGLLFLPVLLINQENASFWPHLRLAGRSPAQIWTELVVWRREPDLFRVNVEFLLLIGLWMGIPTLRRPSARILFVCLYLVAFAYYLYEAVSLTFFSVEPVFYSQFRMATEGFGFFLQNARISGALVLGVLLLVAAGIAAVFQLARLVFPIRPRPVLSPVSALFLGLLILLGGFLAYTNRERLYRSEMVVSSLVAKLRQNVKESVTVYRNVQRFDDDNVRRAYDYAAFHLEKRPPIYIIFVESYGTVLYKRPDWRTEYGDIADRLNKVLEDAGWYAASARSLAPTWGGGSWMSYTSALFGLRIDSDPFYYALLDKYHLDDYPDLGRFLVNQGYRYYRLTALSSGMRDTIWTQYMSFFGVDRWLKHADLNYVGPEYGWGPSPPDQFSLNKAREIIRQETDGPYLFFTITQNSHYPWTPLPDLAASWQELNVPGEAPAAESELIEHSERRQNYLHAVEYQLEMLTNFILTEPNDDAIFVLVGDHQPPRVSRREDGWDTPMHIISGNEEFIDSFRPYGFVKGLAVWDPEPEFHHEGFYSLFVRQLLAAYGRGADLPAYLPLGVQFRDR